jgi:hypothetical protein
VPVVGFDRIPLASTVLEPTTSLGQVGAVLGVAGTVAGLDHPEALVGQGTDGQKPRGLEMSCSE